MIILLITRPLYEPTTHYLFYWNKHVINFAIRKSVTFFDLAEDKANKRTLISYLKNRNPNLILFNGHGSADLIVGQNDEVLVKVGENEDILKGKIIYALSCSTGKKLGPKSITAGAKSYIGYKEDFVFWSNSNYTARPLTDPRAKLFLEPSNMIGISLLKGNTVKEACEKAKKRIRENAQRLIAENSYDSFVIPDLLLNMVHLDYFGDGAAKLS